MSLPGNIHATGLQLGGLGVMLRGPSGAGKSLLALELFDLWEARGLEALLVGDDRLDLLVDGVRLMMHGPENIEGLIELRGRGIVRRASIARCQVHVVVDMVPLLERMIEESELVTEVMGISLPRCPVPQAGIVDARHQIMLIRQALREVSAGKGQTRQKDT